METWKIFAIGAMIALGVLSTTAIGEDKQARKVIGFLMAIWFILILVVAIISNI